LGDAKERGKNMLQILAFSPLTKIVFIIWVLLTAIVILMLFVPKTSETASARIVIHLSEELQKLNLRFELLHVRDGKDEVKDSGPLLNEEVPFRAIDRHGTLEANVRYSKRLGFQFKCFVNQGEYGYGQLEQLLKDSQFVEISKGVGPKFRIFFILQDYPTYKTIDGFLNNYFYPS
jgi:hypothetical protein